MGPPWATRPLEALIADALTKKKLMAAPQLMKAWGGQKQHITSQDFVGNVLALGVTWPEAELQALFERINTGKMGQIGSKVVNMFSFWLIGTSQLVPFC